MQGSIVDEILLFDVQVVYFHVRYDPHDEIDDASEVDEVEPSIDLDWVQGVVNVHAFIINLKVYKR